MTGAFEDLNFLMSTENRIIVLKAIARKPRTKEDLIRSTQTSKVTVGRIIDDFQKRGWIERDEEVYRPTFLGLAVAADTQTLEETVAIANRFRPMTKYFTSQELDFDPRLLREAIISRSPNDSAFDHVDRWTTLFRSCDHFKGLTSHVTATLLEVFIEEMRESGLTMVGIFTGELVNAINQDAEKRDALVTLLDLGAEFYEFRDATWDFALALYDENRMSVAGFDQVGTPRIKVESESQALREWAEAKFQEYQAQSVPINLP